MSAIFKSFSRLNIFAITIALSFITIMSVTGSSQAGKRVALVIGNSDYANAGRLKNPKNDAVDMSEKLVGLGFEVIGGFDLSNDAMKRKVRDFSRALDGAEVSLFFYAGHAMQINGKNYLAPIDTDIAHESDLDFETVSMGLIQSQMERYTKTSLIFLDACRDNPLTRSMWSKSRSKGPQGLAKSSGSAEGTLIAFSTQPGNVALDGDGRNSPFTKALLDNIGRSNIEISTLMTDVRMQVHASTKEKQLPWARSSLLGRFYFTQTEEVQVKVASTGPVAAPTAEVITQAQNSATNQNQIAEMTMQKMAWESVKDSNDADMYNAFINKYEGSFFSELAKAKLTKLEKSKNTQVASLQTKPAEQPAEQVLPPVTKSRNASLGGDLRSEAMSKHEIAYQLQVSLNNVGCSPGRPDGKWGRNSNRALDAFARYSGMSLISYSPTFELLNQVKKFEHSGRNNGSICPKRRVVTKRKVIRQQKRAGFDTNGIAGAIIGGVIACKVLRKC